MNMYFVKGCLIWTCIAVSFFVIRKKSTIHSTLFNYDDRKQRIAITFIGFLVCLGCVLPMSLSPKYNGQIPNHRNQYELMADAILGGHLYMDLEVDEKLLEMENPYDPIARDECGVTYYWDHAFYNGHYYMYFGVVPVFLLFIPYKLITGHTLITYHATQMFVVGVICCFFLFFAKIIKTYFKKTSLGLYLMMSIAMSVLSIYYIIDAPALYCTAIASGICLEIWSLYFYFDVVCFSNDKSKNIKILTASTFGALAFGCRPTIALANILAIPLVIKYSKQKDGLKNVIKDVLIAMIPYVTIGILLMFYNYARFDNVFEFGQSFQLTADDQHNISNIFARYNYDVIKMFISLLLGIKTYFIDFNGITTNFPFVSFNGAYINFPILLSSFLIFNRKIREELIKRDLFLIILCLFVLPFFISIVNMIWCPVINERYRHDFYFLMALLSFIMLCFYNENNNVSFILCVILLCTIYYTILLYLIPWEHNFTDYYNCTNTIWKCITFGL